MHAVTGGQRVVAGRYLLRDRIGRGAMGTVWRARDPVLARDVAVKEVQVPGLLTERERGVLQQRTLREARAAARLNHPGVVTVFDVVEADGNPWIVMELVQARSLEQILAEDGPLPPHEAAEVGAMVLGALACAHAAGIMHRDVKPSNVLLGDEGRAVLTDFGIATLEGDPGLTQAGMVMGTPGFCAPERIRGEPATPASDLWSLGATLFAAVEGHGPFAGRSTPIAALAAVANEEAPPARSAGPIGPIIAALLRRDPGQRPDLATAGRILSAAARPASSAGLGAPTAPAGQAGQAMPAGRMSPASPAPGLLAAPPATAPAPAAPAPATPAQPGPARFSPGHPGSGHPGSAQPGSAQPGSAQPGSAFGSGHPGSAQPGSAFGSAQPGSAHPGSGQPGSGHPGSGHPGSGHPGSAQPGSAQPGSGQPGSAFGSGHPGSAQPGSAQPGSAQPGSAQPGSAQPGSGHPGSAQPGSGHPGSGQPLPAPSRHGQQAGPAAAALPGQQGPAWLPGRAHRARPGPVLAAIGSPAGQHARPATGGPGRAGGVAGRRRRSQLPLGMPWGLGWPLLTAGAVLVAGTGLLIGLLVARAG